MVYFHIWVKVESNKMRKGYDGFLHVKQYRIAFMKFILKDIVN